MKAITTMVGLSGGVDSSVAAYLIQESGATVAALFMKNWEEDDNEVCTAEEDLADAQSVADKLAITLHTRNFSGEYWQNVFEIFLQEYKNGRTPNPDVLCNREIKFKTFLEHAILLGADNIATGHYARIGKNNSLYRLLKARDENKDQSYFLHLLDQYQLSRTEFPLGELTKPEVRKIAAQQGFDNHAKKDSTGICFIGERNFKNFLAEYLPAQPGEIRSTKGIVMGQHDGLMYYTIGQRQGLGIGGQRHGSNDPWYVANKDLDNNILEVVQGHDHPLLFSRTLRSSDIHWIAETPSAFPYRCCAKIRYRQADQTCILTKNHDNSYQVEFEQAQRAVTPGQSVVFYVGDECLGGGIIETTFR